MVGQIEANSKFLDLLSSLSPRASGRGGNNEILHISGFKSVHPMHKTSQSTFFLKLAHNYNFIDKTDLAQGLGVKLLKL